MPSLNLPARSAHRREERRIRSVTMLRSRLSRESIEEGRADSGNPGGESWEKTESALPDLQRLEIAQNRQRNPSKSLEQPRKSLEKQRTNLRKLGERLGGGAASPESARPKLGPMSRRPRLRRWRRRACPACQNSHLGFALSTRAKIASSILAAASRRNGLRVSRPARPASRSL